jgi:two-component system NtrC family response regulator
MKSIRILVIDDERVICDACELVLTEKSHVIDRCVTGKAGLQAINQGDYDIVLLDMKLPDIDGLEILQAVCQKTPMPRVIAMTGYSTMSNAVQAMKLGAMDYLAKPFTDDELISAVENAFSKERPPRAPCRKMSYSED